MLVPGHVVSLYVATSGYNGAALGSDEKEVVLLIYVIIDVQTNNIVGVKQFFVRPTNPIQQSQQQSLLNASSASQNNISSSNTSLDNQSLGSGTTTTTASNATATSATTSSSLNSSSAGSSLAPCENAISQEIPAIESLIATSGRPLEEVIEQFDAYTRSSRLTPTGPTFGW